VRELAPVIDDQYVRGQMKKRSTLPVILTALVCIAAIGCSNTKIDTAKVRAAFPSIQGDAGVQLERGLAAIDASDYAAAVKPLEKATYELKMDKKQREILEDALKKCRAKAARQ
jgi:hypothetical protein